METVEFNPNLSKLIREGIARSAELERTVTLSLPAGRQDQEQDRKYVEAHIAFFGGREHEGLWIGKAHGMGWSLEIVFKDWDGKTIGS